MKKARKISDWMIRLFSHFLCLKSDKFLHLISAGLTPGLLLGFGPLRLRQAGLEVGLVLLQLDHLVLGADVIKGELEKMF